MASISLIIGEFVLVAIACAYLLYYYKSIVVTKDVIISVYLAWVLGLAGILLLPYDLSLAIVDGHTNHLLDIIWGSIYWR